MIPIGDARAFKFEYKGITNVLRTPVQIIEANDPAFYETNNSIDLAQFIAIWDTGATHTCITEEVVKKCKLHSTGIGKASTPKGDMIVKKHLIDVVLPDNFIVGGVVANLVKEINGAQVLIGMDVIGHGDFAVTNQGHTTFTFRIPSRTTIDFVEETQIGRLPRALRRQAIRNRKK